MIDFDAMWDYSQPEQTEQQFRSLLGQARTSKDSDYLPQLLTQIARAQGLQGEFEAAHQTLDEVQTLLNDSTVVAEIRYYLERGRVFRSSSNVEEAIPLFLRAWEHGIQAGEDDYAVDAAHMLGIAETTAEKRMEWNIKALQHAESSHKAKRWLGSLYNNIGWAYVEQGELEKALDLFHCALEFRKSQGNSRTVFIAKWSVAKVLRLLGRVDEALFIQQGLLEETQLMPEPDGYVYEELAECLLKIGEEDEARTYFSLCYERFQSDKWLTANEPGRVARIQQLAGR